MKKRVKVLHATMSLNIGGAETHIVELAKYLNGTSYEIHVASNGGVYEKELQEAGIAHHQVPLHTKDPVKVFKAYRALKKVIKEEKIDIVHAHARIPGFIAGLICRRMGLPIVTTTHFPFKVNYLLRRITNWGDKSIAVSEDLKAYLQKEYNYDEKDVYLSVNGIDTDKFKPSSKEDTEVIKVVQVSRLDKETSEAAEFLIHRAEAFYQLDKRLRVVIVGGGTELSDLQKKADAVNKKAGLSLVTMTGPISDVPGILSTASIFVGISRSALEAMCYEVPVVLAGNYGMYGYLDQQGLAKSEPTNFTGRGEAPLTEETLFQAVKMAWEKRNEDYSWSRAYIQDRYSVARMAKPYLDLYEEMITAPKKYVVAGYYGYANSGDDSLLDAICRDLIKENPENEVTILTKQPNVEIGHKNVSGVYRFNLIKVWKTIRKSHILVMGGGSLLQDKTSSRSLWYYLSLIGASSLLKKRCYLYANGIGPIYGKFNRWLTRRIVNQVDVITLREVNSMKNLENLRISQPYMEVTADPVFTLEFDQNKKISQDLLPDEFDINQPFTVIVARQWDKEQHFVKALAEVGDRLVVEKGFQVLFVPLKYPDDLKVEAKIQGKMAERSFILDQRCDVDTLINILGSAHIILSMRLHGIIYGAMKEIPVIGLSYDVKVDYYTRALGMPLIEDITSAKSEVIFSKVELLLAEYEENQKILKQRVTQLTTLAQTNAQLLRTLF